MHLYIVLALVTSQLCLSEWFFFCLHFTKPDFEQIVFLFFQICYYIAATASITQFISMNAVEYRDLFNLFFCFVYHFLLFFYITQITVITRQNFENGFWAIETQQKTNNARFLYVSRWFPNVYPQNRRKISILFTVLPKMICWNPTDTMNIRWLASWQNEVRQNCQIRLVCSTKFYW